MINHKSLTLEQWWLAIGELVNNRLDDLLPVGSDDDVLVQAMRYAILPGGKRLRPAMVLAVGVKNGQESIPPVLIDVACAVELIHCYSLIHDDLPCMDDDDYRRGQPSCHKAYGQAMALLAGDCLHSLAFEVLAGSGLPVVACSLLAKAAGRLGMGGGQALDINHQQLKDDTIITKTHVLKTGALFAAALQLGLLCRLDEDNHLKLLMLEFGKKFGLMFQIINDIADQTQDEKRGKITYTSLSLKMAKKKVGELQAGLIDSVKTVSPRLAGITQMMYSASW